ncbi:MAG TPA: ATP-dependent Clp protease proteolytic subunit [Tepidisphaeraceae bacterium]|jgi:ATP-dependent Clp protease protease subunit|nr:ATP-dependent Clp protease proteolytic subunit [Tepidisphaeraceae bacterium]HEV8605510.1 ATP-dependent Clp protease proteolytic subunit [Tepidisphaeraceae bacterium]
MYDINPRKLAPKLMERAEKYLEVPPPRPSVHHPHFLSSPRPAAPMIAPVSMPGAPTPGGYMRYREMTIDEMLLENRVVFMVGEINHVSASNCIMRLLYLQSVKRDQDINLYINSPGGVVDDTLAIYDIMRFMTCDIATYCIGRAESGGAIVFMAGKKGKRFILPNAKVMIHQPFGGVYGQAADIEIQAEEILKTKDTLINIMSKCTGQTTDRVREDSERDRFFDAKQAVAYGICDEILGDDTSMKTVEAAADATKPK